MTHDDQILVDLISSQLIFQNRVWYDRDGNQIYSFCNQVRIICHTPDVIIPTFNPASQSYFVFSTPVHPIMIPPHGSRNIPTEFSLSFPPHYFAYVKSYSFGGLTIPCQMFFIQEPIFITMYNESDFVKIVDAGTYICSLRIGMESDKHLAESMLQ
jgi:hypothetical protein